MPKITGCVAVGPLEINIGSFPTIWMSDIRADLIRIDGESQRPAPESDWEPLALSKCDALNFPQAFHKPRLRMPSNALRRYQVYGITLVSELRHNLPEETRETSGDGVLVELRVAQSHIFASLADQWPRNPKEWFRHGILEDGSFYSRWEDCLELLVSPDGKSVLCGNRSNVPLEAFDAYLTNFAVSAALIQQGEEPLHATVVATGDCGVGLVGPCGAGKSTLAAHLINRGWDLLTDDMLRVTFEGNFALAHPGPCRLKLFKEPAERFLETAACFGPFNPAYGQVCNPLNDKLIFQLPDDSAVRGARRLSALFYLDQPSQDGETNKVSVARLGGQNLFKTILSSTMNTRHDAPARLQRHFQFAERLVRAVPVYRLIYRRDYDVLDSIAEQIYQGASQ